MMLPVRAVCVYIIIIDSVWSNPCFCCAGTGQDDHGQMVLLRVAPSNPSTDGDDTEDESDDEDQQSEAVCAVWGAWHGGYSPPVLSGAVRSTHHLIRNMQFNE